MDKALREKLPNGRFENVHPSNSRRMRAIREKGNRSTERRFRALLVRAGIRGWQLHPKGMIGKPDFVFQGRQVVIFVDGCFWHGCPQCGHVPTVNKPYWSAKIERNQSRDREYDRRLQELGFRVLRIWEHELEAGAHECIQKLKDLLPTISS
jgi:DNA mismatch endonuclease, patch repair protein